MTLQPSPTSRAHQIRIAELEGALYTLHAHADRQARWLRRGLVAGMLLVVLAASGGYLAAALSGQRELATANAEAETRLAAAVASAQPATQAAGEAAIPTGGIALPPATDPAILKLQKQAAGGDFKAQLRLAALYEAGLDPQGHGLPRDLKLAQTLLQNAATGGYPPAMYELGRAYAAGRLNPDGTADRHAAARWLEAAAVTGHAAAAFELGQLYEAGLDGAPDQGAALGWYQRAAGYGSDTALAALARLAPKEETLERPDVQKLQLALRALGYDVGTSDGKLGRKTVDAIRSYQASLGLTADGRPTRTLLDHAAADKPVGQGG